LHHESTNGKIQKLQGLEISFDKDREEELNSFKMPLMFAGIGVAILYQVCFKTTERKPSRAKYSSAYASKYDRNKRMGGINKRVSHLEKNL
jgi:hypothetical protein